MCNILANSFQGKKTEFYWLFKLCEAYRTGIHRKRVKKPLKENATGINIRPKKTHEFKYSPPH